MMDTLCPSIPAALHLYSKTSLTRTSGDCLRTSALTEVRVIPKAEKSKLQ